MCSTSDGTELRELHVVGGGASNELLCAWTAEAAQKPVLAGPAEATLVGNLLVQALALGDLATLAEARDVVRRSFEPRCTSPRIRGWNEAQARFAALVAQAGLEVANDARRRPAPASRHPRIAGTTPRPRRPSVLDGLVHRSNLLGADRALANQGAATPPRRRRIADHPGRETRVLWVKGSGTDLATITPPGFPGLRLDELLPLREREEMDDAAMVDYLLRSAIQPDQPRPSIETLLHAFVPATHVDHTHPDAVIALTSTPDGRALAEEAFGDEIVWLDYQRPGFDMSRRIAELLDAAAERARGPAREARARHLGRDARGELPRDDRVRHPRGAARSSERRRALRARRREGRGARRTMTRRRAPRRGAARAPRRALADADGVVLEVDRSPRGGRVRLLAARPRGQSGRRALPGPPDQHEAQASGRRVRPRRGRRRCVAGGVRDGRRDYTGWYRDYYERNLDDETRQFPIDPAGPRVVLVPGVGIVTSGPDAGRARFARDLYHRAIAVQDAADAMGGFRSLERERGVRDRVLAARALQARAGAAARRARRPGGTDHRRRERHRPRNRAHARRARRACRRRRPEPSTAPRTSRRARLGVRRASGARGRGRRHE